MENISNSIERADILLETLPYIRRFYNKTIVIKYGGHAMVVPKRHVATLAGLHDDELVEIARLTRLTEMALAEVYRPQGMNIGTIDQSMRAPPPSGKIALSAVVSDSSKRKMMPLPSSPFTANQPRTASSTRQTCDQARCP